MPAVPLPLLLATASALALARFGAVVRLSTLDADTWQVVCVDPAAPDAALPDHPTAQASTPEAAASAFAEALHRLNLRDAGVLGPEEDEGGGDPRFDAWGDRRRSLADAYPPAPTRRAILPAAVTLTVDNALVDTATREVLLPARCDEAAAEPELRRAEVA